MSLLGKNKKRTLQDRKNDKKRIKLAFDDNNDNVRFDTVPDSKMPVESCSLKRIFVKNMETGQYEEAKNYLMCDHPPCSKNDFVDKFCILFKFNYT